MNKILKCLALKFYSNFIHFNLYIISSNLGLIWKYIFEILQCYWRTTLSDSITRLVSAIKSSQTNDIVFKDITYAFVCSWIADITLI